jgi:hypothetical protein
MPVAIWVNRRHCERSEAIHRQVADAALDRHGRQSGLAMTARQLP